MPRILAAQSAPGFPWGLDEDRQEQILASYDTRWGTPRFGVRSLAPSLADDERFRQWHAQACRFAGTPASALAWFRITMEIDIRDVLPAIRVPTLVLHRTGDRVVPVEAGRYLADKIPGAKLVELPGSDHYPFSAMTEPVARRDRGVPHRLSAVDASPTASSRPSSSPTSSGRPSARSSSATSGGRRFSRTTIASSGSSSTGIAGQEVRVAGDGFLATFDGPARAIRCASAIRDASASSGLEVRAGLHTGEIELAPSGIEGLAVHIGARVVALADAGEILVSSTVKDLVAGSGVVFEDRGVHALKGVPGDWQLHAVA